MLGSVVGTVFFHITYQAELYKYIYIVYTKYKNKRINFCSNILGVVFGEQK